MTDGINMDGFSANRNPAGTNDINASGAYSPADGSFPAASDVSAQGNAGLNREGSSESLPLSGPDYSDTMMGN
ncbi:MAG: hypothetical protein NT035_01315 [Burkholderiales bacterium]|nr:hypothetical protein [Burkholderiales bacterium]